MQVAYEGNLFSITEYPQLLQVHFANQLQNQPPAAASNGKDNVCAVFSASLCLHAQLQAALDFS